MSNLVYQEKFDEELLECPTTLGTPAAGFEYLPSSRLKWLIYASTNAKCYSILSFPWMTLML